MKDFHGHGTPWWFVHFVELARLTSRINVIQAAESQAQIVAATLHIFRHSLIQKYKTRYYTYTMTHRISRPPRRRHPYLHAVIVRRRGHHILTLGIPCNCIHSSRVPLEHLQ
jgi:hypothetical protein